MTSLVQKMRSLAKSDKRERWHYYKKHLPMHMRTNVARNSVPNAEVVPSAFAATSGTVYWREHRGASSGHVVSEAKGNTPVSAQTLQELVTDVTKPALMKFDIHGAEYDGLLAASEILARLPKVTIFLEFYPVSAEREAAFWAYIKSLKFDTHYQYTRADMGAVYWLLTRHI